MEHLLTAIRQASVPAMWNKGVELARVPHSVTLNHQNDTEWVLSVAESGKPMHYRVTLWPTEEDWQCSCPAPEDPCAHIIASVICAKQAFTEARPMAPTQGVLLTLGYRFKRKHNVLLLERVIQYPQGMEKPLTYSLLSQQRGRVQKDPPGEVLHMTKEDLTIDHLLVENSLQVVESSLQEGGQLGKFTLKKLLALFTKDMNLSLEGVGAITCDPTPKGLILRVVDENGGVRLLGVQDPSIDETFINGAVLCGSVLHPFSQPALSVQEWEWFSSKRFFGPQDLPLLVSELLPAWRQKLPVELWGTNLPKTIEAEVHVYIDTWVHQGRYLGVKVKLGYGDPPLAWIDADDHLVCEGCYGPLRHVPLRHAAREKQLKHILKHQLKLDLHALHILEPKDAIALVPALKALGVCVQGTGYRGFELKGTLQPSVLFDQVADALEVRFDIASGVAQEGSPDLWAVMQAWQRGESLVPLRLGGGFAQLPMDWLNAHGAKVLDCLSAQKALTSKKLSQQPAYFKADVAALFKQTGSALPGSLQAAFEVYGSHASGSLQMAPMFQCPGLTLIQATLRPYQQEGVRWLYQHRRFQVGALLADDMGLGKTLQAACLLEPQSLVVAPTSVLFNWQQELAKFRPDLVVNLYHGSQRSWNPQADVVLTSYALVRLEAQQFQEVSWACVVLDEAQTIKNPNSQTAQACYPLSGAFRIALTGTPLENQLDDLWSIFQFLNPGCLGELGHFRERYTKPLAAGDRGARAQLRSRVSPYMLRRTKKEVAKDLPPRTERLLLCELSEEERRLYELLRATTQEELFQKMGREPDMLHLLEALLRLRQVCCHSRLLHKVAMGGWTEALPGYSAKTERLMACLEESLSAGHKSLIFSQWTSYLDILGEELTRRQIAFLRIDGSTQRRGEITGAFQKEGSSYPVMLLSLKAAGVGLNLTAADHVFITDPWWNPAVEDQAADRAHRIGQNKPVMVHKLVCKDTLEEKIIDLQQAKRALFQAVLEDNSMEIPQGVTKQDLLGLL